MNTEENTIIAPAFGIYGSKLSSQFSLTAKESIADGECFLLNEKNNIKAVLAEMKKQGFHVLSTINCVEYKEGMQIIYHLINLINPDQPINVFVKANMLFDAGLNIDTVSDLYASANWYERELYDLQGIIFDGHNDLNRILSPDLWTGHPLRKDYIPPLDTLNGPVSTTRAVRQPSYSIRQDVEVIVEQPETQEEV